MNYNISRADDVMIESRVFFNFEEITATTMTRYYAYVEDFKRFMQFFRDYYPELYMKYKTCISFPEKGMNRAIVKRDKFIRPATHVLLTHIITEFYIVRCN